MFIFPVHVLAPRTVSLYLERQTLSGGTALSGDTDTIEADGGGRWVLEYGGISLLSAEQARIWGAWVEFLAGGTTVCLAPTLSFATSPRPETSLRRPKRPSDLYVDDREWPTVMEYALRDHEARVSADAVLRATEISFAVDRGPAIGSGQVFGLPGGRVHRVTRPSGGSSFSVRPPLREAVNSGTDAVFDFPLLRVRADTGQNNAFPLERGKLGEGSIRFVESLT